jgi:hypothetical protein
MILCLVDLTWIIKTIGIQIIFLVSKLNRLHVLFDFSPQLSSETTITSLNQLTLVKEKEKN